MILAKSDDQIKIRSLKANKGVELYRTTYRNFLDKNLFVSRMLQFRRFKGKCVFKHHNEPSHLSNRTWEFFDYKRFTGEKILKWPASTFDLNLLENLRSIVKIKVVNNIVAKQTCGKQIKLPCRKLNQSK